MTPWCWNEGTVEQRRRREQLNLVTFLSIELLQSKTTWPHRKKLDGTMASGRCGILSGFVVIFDLESFLVREREETWVS